MDTYLLWENGRAQPLTRYFPAIFSFLGYDPFPLARTLPEQIAAQRRRLGWPIKKAAAQVGVDEGTFARWERGDWKPRQSREVVRRFLEIEN